ncbi:MAG TPA: hypothetical protein VIN09_01100, partial [Chloroflexota bacterium]
AWAVWQRERDALAAGLAGLLFLGSTYVYHVTPLARVNALAVCFAVLALALLQRGGGRALWAPGVAFLLALYAKQTMLDALAAGLLWLALRDVRRALVLGVGVVGVGGGLYLLLDGLSRGQMHLNLVVGNANPWQVQQAVAYAVDFATIHFVLLLAAVAGLARTARQQGLQALTPFHCYVPLALGFSLTVGKWGAGESYFLPAIAAVCAVGGMVVAGLRRAGPSAWRVALPFLVLAQALLFWHGPVATLWPRPELQGLQGGLLGRPPTPADVEAGYRVVRWVEAVEGPALAEEVGFLLVARRPVVGNATHLRNLYEAGRWNPERLVSELRDRRYGLVVLNAQLYPAPVLQAVGTRYYLRETVEMNGFTYLIFLPGA